MATHKPQPAASHPICPTCEGDLTGRELLHYLASARCSPLRSDDVSNFYEEVARLVRFLGALAQSGPLAVAFHFNGKEDARNDYTPEWVSDFVWLAQDLTEETERRLRLLDDAGGIWQRRAEEKTANKKEG